MTSDTTHNDPPQRDVNSGEGPREVRILGANRAGGLEPHEEASSGAPDEGADTFDDWASAGTEETDDGEPGQDATDRAPGFGPEDWAEVAVPVEPALPHWTEAPTGEIPAVLSRHESGDEDDPWAALPEPSWREGHADWAQEESIAPALRGGGVESGGLLGEADVADRQPWSFELGDAGTEDDELDEAFDDEPGEDDVVYYEEERRVRGRVETRDDERGLMEARDRLGTAPEAEEAPVTAAFEPLGIERAPRHGAPDPAASDEPDQIAGEKTSVLRLTEIAAGTQANEDAYDDERHEEHDPVAEAEAAALAADLEERGGRRVSRSGLRAPGARRGAQGSHPRPAPGGPATRAPRATPSGGRGAIAAPSTLRHGEDRVSQRTGRNITAAILSGVVIGAVALVAFHFGSVPSMVVVTVVLTLAATEAFGAFRRAGYHPATLLGLVAVVGLLVATYDKTTEALPAVVVLLVAATFFWHLVGVDRRAEPVRSVAATVLVFCWVGVFGSFAALLLAPSLFPHRTGIAYLLGALIAAVAYDVGALAVGAWVGRRPLSAVSPGKTWEGLVGGAICAIVLSVVVVHLIHPWTLKEAAVLGVVVAVVSPIGDLCESLVKRHLGLKDMGRLLPGHGGLLDRVDGLLFVLPATYYLVRAFH